jgi:hypothetical protein
MSEPRLKVDFNNITEEGLIRAYRKLASDSAGLEVGMSLVLFDGEGGGLGNRCLGVVRDLTDKVAQVEVQPGTWVDAEPVKVSGDLVKVLLELTRPEARNGPATATTVVDKDELAPA